MRDDGLPELGGVLPYAHYDRRRYRTVSIEEGYAAWSREYGEFVDELDVDLLDRAPLVRARIAGARVGDLACGNGRLGRWLRARGAGSVIGVDRSKEMLALAEARGVYDRALLADLRATGLASGELDVVLCSMALCHVPDVGDFFAEAKRLLAPRGCVALVDYHPHFLLNGIPTHFDPVDGGEPLAIENHVHPFSTLFGAATSSGFEVRDLQERFVDARMVARLPRYAVHLGLPITHLWVLEAR